MIKIILIDDDDVLNYCNKRVLEKVYGKENLRIDIFETVDGALEYLRRVEEVHYPNYLFLDINLPIKDGWDFLRDYEVFNFNEKFPELSIFVTSTSLYEHDQKKARNNQFVTDFILKPIVESSIVNYILI